MRFAYTHQKIPAPAAPEGLLSPVRGGPREFKRQAD